MWYRHLLRWVLLSHENIMMVTLNDVVRSGVLYSLAPVRQVSINITSDIYKNLQLCTNICICTITYNSASNSFRTTSVKS
jgi:hypothetical protein